MRHNHPFCRPLACLFSALSSLLIPCCGVAFGQNLYTQPSGTAALPLQPQPAQVQAAAPAPAPQAKDATPPPPAPPQAAIAAPAPTNSLAAMSLFAVTPPTPRKYEKHDLIEVIINESSMQKFDETLDSKKDYSLQAELSKFPSLEALFSDFALQEGIGAVKPSLGVTSNNKFKGDASLDRKDQVQAKITATVIDVKPNGTLVLEARESIASDRETTTMVLAGACRTEDITRNNTIQSSQLANLNIRIEHSGDVRDANNKGIIPRVLEAIFNF